jgi:uncharacterized protein
MRLVVLDTNVIVSARIGTLGPSASIVSEYLLRGLVRCFTCPSVVEEYFEVVRRPKFARFRFPPPWLDWLIDESLHLSDPPTWPHPLPDASGVPFLALAHAAGAWLITGNLKHFPADRRHGVTVLPPAEYLARLNGP